MPGSLLNTRIEYVEFTGTGIKKHMHTWWVDEILFLYNKNTFVPIGKQYDWLDPN